MEKNHFAKILTSFDTVLLKITLCSCIYFAFTKKPIILAYLKLIH